MSIIAFEQFYVQWIEEMNSLFNSLRAALQQSKTEDEVGSLVQACYSHYSHYMEQKMKICQEDASYVVAGMWRTPLEAGFMWIGGWRPTTAVVLAYSLMGLQIESELQKLIEGIELPTMAALSAKQISLLDSLQQRIRVSEDELSNRLAVLQMLLADQQMAKATSAIPPPSESNNFSDVREAMQPKLAALRDLLVEAEKLRGQTIGEMVNILRSIQAGQYALAAYEMSIAVQKLGNHREGHSLLSELSNDVPTNITDVASQDDVQDFQKTIGSGLDSY